MFARSICFVLLVFFPFFLSVIFCSSPQFCSHISVCFCWFFCSQSTVILLFFLPFLAAHYYLYCHQSPLVFLAGFVFVFASCFVPVFSELFVSDVSLDVCFAIVSVKFLTVFCHVLFLFISRCLIIFLSWIFLLCDMLVSFRSFFFFFFLVLVFSCHIYRFCYIFSY